MGQVLSNDAAAIGGVPIGAVKAAAKAISNRVAGEQPAEEAQAEAFDKMETGSSDAHGIARDQLRAFIRRIEGLEEEKAKIASDIKDVYGEAKAMGFDTKILRKVVSIRKQDHDERLEQQAILDTYLQALGMMPAGEYA